MIGSLCYFNLRTKFLAFACEPFIFLWEKGGAGFGERHAKKDFKWGHLKNNGIWWTDDHCKNMTVIHFMRLIVSIVVCFIVLRLTRLPCKPVYTYGTSGFKEILFSLCGGDGGQRHLLKKIKLWEEKDQVKTFCPHPHPPVKVHCPFCHVVNSFENLLSSF